MKTNSKTYRCVFSLLVFSILAFCNSAFAQNVIRYNSGGTQKSSGATLSAAASGMATGDVFKVYANINENSYLSFNSNSLSGITIQSDTSGTQRTITSSTSRILNGGNSQTLALTYNFKDLKFKNTATATLDVMGGFQNSNRQALTYNCDNVIFDSFNINRQGAVIRVGNYSDLDTSAKALFTLTGTYQFTNNSSNSNGGAIVTERDVTSIPHVLFSGADSVGTFTGNKAGAKEKGNDIYAVTGTTCSVKFQDSGTYSFDGGIVTLSIDIDQSQVTLLGRDTTGTTASYTSATNGISVTNGGKLTISTAENQDHQVVGKITLDATSKLVLDRTSGTTDFTNEIAGAGTITKTGAGTLTLSGANTYSGATTVSAGMLELTNTSAAGTGAITLCDANTAAQNVTLKLSAANIDNSITVADAGTGTVTLYGNALHSDYKGTITLNRDTYFEIPQNGTNDWWFGYTKAISGSGDIIVKGGAGTSYDSGHNRIWFSSDNSGLTGDFIVQSGAAQLSNSKAAGSGTIYVGNANSDTDTVRLILGANTNNNIVISADTPITSMPVIASYNGTQEINSPIAFNRSATLYGSSDRLTLHGVLSGDGDITIDGKRVTHDTVANTWTGDMVIKSGATFQPGHAQTLSAANDIEVNGTLQLNGVNQTIGTLSGAGTIQNIYNPNTLTVNQATDSTFSGTLTNGSGTLTFIKTGVGTLTLSGTNTYTGTTTISGGRIIATNLSAFGTGTVTNNSELEFNLATADSGPYSKVISGSGALYKSGSGTLTLSGANTFKGGMTISEGKVSVATDSTSWGKGALTLNSGATLIITGGDSNKTLAISGAATLNGILDLTNYLTTWETGSTYTLMTANSIDSTTGLTLSGVDTGWGWEQSGTSILLKYSGGTLDWNWTGTTGSFMTATNWENTKVPETTSDVTITKADGVAQIDENATVKTVTLGKASNLQFTVGNTLTAETMTISEENQTLDLTGGNLTLTNAPAFDIDNSAIGNASTLTLSTGAYANVLSGNTNLTKTGDGTLTLSGTNTYTGATTVSAGTLALSGTGVFNSDSVINIAENGTLELASTAYSQSTPFANTITGAGTILQVASSAGMESDISGFTGTFKIQKDVYFTGNIDGSKSEWIVSDGATLKTVSGNTIQIKSITTDSGTYLARNWMDATDPNATYKIGSGIISGTIGYTAGTNETQKQRMSMVALEKVSDGTTSGGTLTLSGENTYTGGTTISGGTLVITNDEALGTGTITLNGGTLSTSGTIDLDENVVINANSTIDTLNGLTLSGNISGTAALTKTGAGTLTLSGSDGTYSGTTTVSAGKLSITNSGAISDSAKIIIESGAEIESNASQTIHNLNGSGTYKAGGELTVNSTLNNNVFNGTIDAGTSNIIFIGNGSQKMSFVPSSTDGTLTATSIRLQSGRLDIKGVVAADLKITNGVFSPGNSVGSLTANSFTLNGGMALFEFDKTLGSDGAWDTLTIVDSGNITRTSGVFSLYIDDYNFWHKVGEEYKLITGTNVYATDTDLTDWLASAYQSAWSLTGKTDGIYLSANDTPEPSVPEPSTWALLILGTLGMMYFRRKK